MTDVLERRPAVVRARILRSRPWIVLGAVIAVAIVVVLVVLGSGATGGPALGPANAEQNGSKALVEVLRGQGIRVVATTTLAETRRAADADATVLVYDSGPYLDNARWQSVGALGSKTVLVEPDQTALDALAPGTTLEPEALDGTLSPRCDLPALAQSDRITGTGSRYTTADRSAVTCLPASEGGGFGVVSRTTGGHETTVVGTSAALTNASAADDDNAAFALALLGHSSTLVWYLPGIADLPKGSGTLASLTPGWVTPSIALLAAAVVAGAFWRGRRLGPLVVENLPVVVRSTETMEGRARLYERGGARLHALDQVRIGTIGRLTRLLGLPRTASVDDVAHRAAALLGVDAREIHRVLVDADPVDDRLLVDLSDSLRDLEAAVARVVGLR